MCGLAGIVFNDPATPVDPALLRRLCDILAHRGPDGEGFFIGPGVGLGHRRLSIIDLEGGRQPMANEDEQIQIVFNGEIYNFQELQPVLESAGHRFRSRCDTECIVHLYEQHGDACVSFLRGMFAFAIWDARRRRLFLARDRLGKKPLYYYQDDRRFIFASEMKAILQVPDVPREVDPAALDLFLAYQYVPAPRTILKHVRKLPPAHALSLENGRIDVRRYWDVPYQPDARMTVSEAVAGLRTLLEESVRLRLISDVPLGAFLSGGIDSSLTVALMARLSSEPVRTFSIGFEEQDFSEVHFARLVARRYQTRHEEFIVKPQAAEILPKLAWHYDEPFADASALPTYYVSKMTAGHVKVALSGDGGDENFAGYRRYQRLALASLAANTLGRALRTRRSPWPLPPAPGAPRGSVLDRGRRLTLSFLCDPRHGYLHSVNLLDRSLREFLYRPEFTSRLDGSPAEQFVLEAFDRFAGDRLVGAAAAVDLVGAAAAVDLVTYLPGAILAKVDIASMANSLEIRAPFLDHRLVEFAATIPARLKMRLFEGKFILKEAFRDLIPAEILNRPKMGFGIPLDRWMAHDLHDFLIEHVLSDQALARGYFRPEALRALVEEHRLGRARHGYHLWPLLMLELWHRAYL